MCLSTPTVIGLSSRVCAVFQVIFRSLKYILVDTITTRYRVGNAASHQRSRDTFTTSHIVKEQPSLCSLAIAKDKRFKRNACLWQQPQGRWWRMTGSNRRPPACKAGALPAELIPPSQIRDNRRDTLSLGCLHSFRYAAQPRFASRLVLTHFRGTPAFTVCILVGLVGLEPTTPALSRRCSNHLSYRPLAVTANKPISVNA